MKKSILILLAFIVYGCGESSDRAPKKHEATLPPPVVTNDNLNQHCIDTLRGKIFEGVTIFRDNEDVARGAVYAEDGIYFLVTAGHVFPSKLSFIFSVHFQSGDTMYVDEHVFDADDQCIVSLSKKKNKFKGFSEHKNWELPKERIEIHEFLFKDTGKKVFSLCGQSYDRVGYINNPMFFGAGLIIHKASWPGESGTLFYDEKGNIFVLSQQHNSDDNPDYENMGIMESEELVVLRPIGFTILVSNVNGQTSMVAWPRIHKPE